MTGERPVQFGGVKSEISMWRQSGDVRKAIGYMSLEFMKDIWTKDINLRLCQCIIVIQSRKTG